MYTWFGGLDVAVDDGLVVGGLERRRHLADDVAGLFEGQSSHPLEPGEEALAVQVLHEQVPGAVGELARVEDAHQARVADDGDGAGLVDEAPHDLGVVTVLRVEDLDRGALADGLVDGLVDGAHAALADQPDDPIRADVLAHPAGSPIHRNDQYNTRRAARRASGGVMRVIGMDEGVRE
jgi:hypothetical protein